MALFTPNNSAWHGTHSPQLVETHDELIILIQSWNCWRKHACAFYGIQIFTHLIQSSHERYMVSGMPGPLYPEVFNGGLLGYLDSLPEGSQLADGFWAGKISTEYEEDL